MEKLQELDLKSLILEKTLRFVTELSNLTIFMETNQEQKEKEISILVREEAWHEK